MSKRVLVIGEYGTRNGGENSFLSVAPTLQEFGWVFCAAVPLPSEFANALGAIGISIHGLSLLSGGERKSQPQIRTELAELIRRLDPALIHCNSLSTSRLCGPVAHELNVPGMGYLRDIIKLSRQAITDINKLNRIIAVSEATRQMHCQAGIAADKTFVVFNGVDTSAFSPGLECESAEDSPLPGGIPAEAKLLVFVGQIGMRKGVDILLQAFLEIAQHFPDAHLLIVGQRHSSKPEAIEYEQRLIDQAATSKYEPRIHWLGWRTDVAELMRRATLLIHPARQEPLGRVLLEAAASGLPILTTRVGGSPEILSDPDLQALLFEPDHVDELVAKILCLLENPERRKIVGQKLRQLALQQFPIERCSDQLNRHYHQISRN